MEESYKRQVKFCYYRVFIANEDKNGGTIKEKFNLVDWLMRMEDQEMLKHIVQLSDCKVNLEQIERYKNDDIYIVRAYKLRDSNIPSKIKEGEDAQTIQLEDDEYIGEDVSFLFDRKRCICMFQHNRMSLSITKLEEWINESYYEDGFRVIFQPIIDGFNINKMGKKRIRQIEFSFLNEPFSDNNSSLGQIISSLGKYGYAAGKITLSVGRAKNKELNKTNSINLIKELTDNSGTVSGAKIKLKQDEVCEDDKARIDIIDLFENSLHDYISFDIKPRKPLDFLQVKQKMLKKYKERENIFDGTV